MRNTFKMANKLDSFYSLLLTLPVLFMIAHAGLQLHTGKISQSDFNAQALTNATQVVERATSNYRPFVEATGKTMAAGLSKAASAATGCLASSSKVIHLTAQRSGCGSSKIKNLRGAFRGGTRPIHLR